VAETQDSPYCFCPDCDGKLKEKENVCLTSHSH